MLHTWKQVLTCRCPYYDLTPDIGSPTSTLANETADSDDTSYFSDLTTTTDTCAPSVRLPVPVVHTWSTSIQL